MRCRCGHSLVSRTSLLAKPFVHDAHVSSEDAAPEAGTVTATGHDRSAAQPACVCELGMAQFSTSLAEEKARQPKKRSVCESAHERMVRQRSRARMHRCQERGCRGHRFGAPVGSRTCTSSPEAERAGRACRWTTTEQPTRLARASSTSASTSAKLGLSSEVRPAILYGCTSHKTDVLDWPMASSAASESASPAPSSAQCSAARTSTSTAPSAPLCGETCSMAWDSCAPRG